MPLSRSEAAAAYGLVGFDLKMDIDVLLAAYNVLRGAMESCLVSREAQTVRVDARGKSFSLKPYGPMHIEDSFKYLPDALWRVEKR
ncbi:MAG: hypothetical protein KGL53_12130 [Elusimicrobia bacterium]|nr:hypothetical protein [Elusimicrobiota bacterium]